MKRSGMTNTLRRLVRRFWVPRSEYDSAVEALRLAYGHITSHHACNIMDKMELGGFCPVCHHADGTEPEMDKIVAAIHTANAHADGRGAAPRTVRRDVGTLNKEKL